MDEKNVIVFTYIYKTTWIRLLLKCLNIDLLHVILDLIVNLNSFVSGTFVKWVNGCSWLEDKKRLLALPPQLGSLNPPMGNISA